MPQNENPESKDAIHLSKFGLEDNNEPIFPPDITDEEHQKITEKTSADYMNSKMKQQLSVVMEKGESTMQG